MRTEKEIVEKMKEVLSELKLINEKLARCNNFVDKDIVLGVHDLTLKSLGWCLGIVGEWDVKTIVTLNE